MTTSHEIATLPTQVAASPVPVAAMLQAVIEKGVTSENVGALEKLVGLYERMQDKDAERQFAVAFNGLQAETPNIQAMKPVPAKDGTIKYYYAPYEEVMAAVGPMLRKFGFTVAFSMRVDGSRIVQSCTLQHLGGHSRTNEFMVRIGSGPPGASEAQADGAAATYAKRMALCSALNIVVERDTDARSEGEPISKEQALELRLRVKETASDEAKFLRYAGAASYEEIGSDNYARLDQLLRGKENAKPA